MVGMISSNALIERDGVIKKIGTGKIRNTESDFGSVTMGKNKNASDFNASLGRVLVDNDRSQPSTVDLCSRLGESAYVSRLGFPRRNDCVGMVSPNVRLKRALKNLNP